MAHVSRDEFEELVLQGLQDIPAALRERIDNVDVVVEDWPSLEELAVNHIHSKYALLGLYQGIPLTQRSNYGMVLPDKITIFRYPIEALCATREDIVRQVRKTVIHEVAHHFGIDDASLDTTEYG